MCSNLANLKKYAPVVLSPAPCSTLFCLSLACAPSGSDQAECIPAVRPVAMPMVRVAGQAGPVERADGGGDFRS